MPNTKIKPGFVFTAGTPYRAGDTVLSGKRATSWIIDDPLNDSARKLFPAEYKWSEYSAGIGAPASELNHAGRAVISAEDALNRGIDISTLVRVAESNFYYKPQKEYPVSKVETRAGKPVQYNTIGVRFLDGANLAKVYTYRLPKKARVHLGQEVVVPTDKNGIGYITQSVAVVVRIDTVKQDTEHYDYKFVTGTIKPL